MKKTFILILLVFALVGICVACPPQCGPGEVWGQTGERCYQVPAVYGQCNECAHHHEQSCTSQYGYWTGPSWNRQWHDRTGQNCPGGQTCVFRQVCEDQKVYDCHSEGYVSCDGANHEKRIISPAHQHCDPIFGCIATTCPAIPCPTGQDCVDGQCLPRVCPRIPCDTGFHCEENQCDPDICGEDFICEQGYVCNPDLTNCIRKPSMTPYTESECQELINAQYPMDGIDPSTLTEIGLDDTYISASFKYASQFDCVALAYYTRGEPSFSKNCKAVEFFNRKQDEVHSYGGMPILTALDPAQAICVLAVKNSPSDTTLPVTITLTDSFGNVGDVITSPEPVIKKCYSIPDVFDECRMAGVYLPFSPWVGK